MSVPLVVLIVLDGWGLAPPSSDNAISLADTPNMDRFWAGFPHTQLAASGEAVGLPHGEPGNTETGHLNLGAGQIVYQDLPRINMAIANGSFFKNTVFIEAIKHAKKNNSNLHLMGLLGAGGVHSNKEHLYALLRLCKEQNFNRVFIHVFTDGRDSPPTAAHTYIAELETVIKNEAIGTIASVMGRYWAMDRDLRWERTAKAYFALTGGEGRFAESAIKAVEDSYAQNISDEFIEPRLIVKNNQPIALIKENDAVFFYNFRIDRPRQLTKAFVKMKNLFFVTMTEYGKSLRDKTQVAFPPNVVRFPLGAVISEKGYRQLRIAESEKERFVTFYFNGQNEGRYPGEEWVIVKSPQVPTYDQKPEMAAKEITAAFLSKIGTASPSPYRFALINFANPDMVGHSGNIEAIKKACSAVDAQVARIVSKLNSLGGVTLITADHGNAEQSIDTEHSINPVPFIAVGNQFLGNPQTLHSGILADVAPTVLLFLDIERPTSMTGRPLL